MKRTGFSIFFMLCLIFLPLFPFTDNLNHINENEKIYLEKENR
jgi:hypothetical protein